MACFRRDWLSRYDPDCRRRPWLVDRHARENVLAVAHALDQFSGRLDELFVMHY